MVTDTREAQNFYKDENVRGHLQFGSLIYPDDMDGNNFYQQVRVTADGRWFDNCGFPIDPPTKVEEEEEKTEVGFVHREQTEEEKTEQAKWKATEEQRMLKKLK